MPILSSRQEILIGTMRRRRDGVRSRNRGEMLELKRHFVDELLEGHRAIFQEGGLVFAYGLINTVFRVQAYRQLEAKAIHARRIAVELRRADGEFDEILILAVRSAEVEVHPA